MPIRRVDGRRLKTLMRLVPRPRLKSSRKWHKSNRKFSSSVSRIDEIIGSTIVIAEMTVTISLTIDAIKSMIRSNISPRRSRMTTRDRAAKKSRPRKSRSK